MDSLPTRFRSQVFAQYLDLLKAEFRIHPQFSEIRKEWERELTMERLVHGPFLERAQLYAPGADVMSLGLHPATLEAISSKLKGRDLYKHQTDALERVLAGENVVVATGTSSGKTLCFQLPILDALLRDTSPGLRAVIIYPLNALVNDQLNEWEQLLARHQQLTFAKFTGQTPLDQRDHEQRLRASFAKTILSKEPALSETLLQRKVEEALAERLAKEASTPNHLRHRAAIRSQRPQVLITNFSMLEYLLVRPVDAPIFEGAKLQFLVLDEAHAYRGVQATEIGYLLRRLKDRLDQPQPRCIATSATLGDRNDPASREQVRKFARDLFDAPFSEANPIYGTPAQPTLAEPAITPTPAQYLAAADELRVDVGADVTGVLDPSRPHGSLGALLARDRNLHRLRAEVLTAPKLASDAAKALWPNVPQAEPALHALLEVAAVAKRERGQEDLLPTRLHYFTKAQQGLYLCLRTDCPERARRGGQAAAFLTRHVEHETPEGECPHCHRAGLHSRLVELVSCRKCGWLFGALQDLGPRFRLNPETSPGPQEERFDNFDTALGWAADSFWSYFSLDPELPYPERARPDEDDNDPVNLLDNPAPVELCVACGKKVDPGVPHACPRLHMRTLGIFHRQCPAHDQANLDQTRKQPLACCPNCGARNNSGVELVRRFQESEDETGLAMALPLANFRVGPAGSRKLVGDPRKLLCFTDHRQRAAAFPSLLEEETFNHDLGRKIATLCRGREEAWTFEGLGRELAAIADEAQHHPAHDPSFFLPVSRQPEEPEKKLTSSEPQDLTQWLAEVFSYFGVPDSARESVEDLGLVQVEYELDPGTLREFRALLPALSECDAVAAFQTLFSYVRQARAFTLPKRVPTDAPAFGRVATDIYYAEKREGRTNTRGWLPRENNDGTYRHNASTSYLSRLLGLDAAGTLETARKIWAMLVAPQRQALRRERDDKFQLFKEMLRIRATRERHVCARCGIITAWAAKACCPRKGCEGKLESRAFVAESENATARWVAGADGMNLTSLRSEEHTAQINKDVAREIEEAFRGEGVNLLSSTTTFEMGINIGDLQKILLRNAPSTPAGYVQRVGRAGRGADKNAVCVTLCRGTKYDLDMWRAPERLMSGAMRAPTVFLANRIIAQRHFNAVAFAAFLRELDAAGRLPEKKQSIRLEGFLPSEARSALPKTWRKLEATELFDFPMWLTTRDGADLFHAPDDNAMIDTLAGMDAAKQFALDEPEKGYRALLTALGGEVIALLAERRERVSEGSPIQEVDRSIQNLLGEDVIAMLAREGFLPRYAFPLDVVPLETGHSRWTDDSDVELSRDRAIAISEFAPGAQVVARKRVFKSGGLYIACSEDKPERRWFSQCPSCNQVRARRRKEDLIGRCEVCQQSINDGHVRGYVEPRAFSVSFEGRRRDAARFTKSTLIRQRQSLTHFIDSVAEADFEDGTLFRLRLLPRGKLFRYNLGPSRKGFMLCPHCGTSHPMAGASVTIGHKLLRSRGVGSDRCSCTSVFQRIAFAHQFESFCLVIRPKWPVGSVESVAYALHKGACRCLELDASDLGVAWRFLNRRSDKASGKEIVLFDRTPGGAGFVKEAHDRWDEVEAAARANCAYCTCERACYNCLKDYGNQGYHEALDRHEALAFLSAASAGEPGIGSIPIALVE